MCVAYYSGLRYVAKEWICFEHGGFSQQKAVSWWSQRAKAPCPDKTKDAVEFASAGNLKEPKFISVDDRGDFPVLGYYINDPRIKVAA